MIKVGIMGATGYAGQELLRLLLGHPRADIAYLGSASHAGRRMSDLYPGYFATALPRLSPADPALAGDCDVVFTALPHGAADDAAAALLSLGVRVIDLSADYRYADAGVYQAWYNRAHNHPALLQEAVYGLTELNAHQVPGARLVANPGCYPTCAILGLLPLVRQGLIDTGSIVIDAKSGATGAGRGLSQGLHFCEAQANLKAYGIATHRHTSEIEVQLSAAAGQPIAVSFTPHLLPVKRGILATCYAKLAAGATAGQLVDLYRDTYRGAPFVRVMDAGATPEFKHVVGSNLAAIGLVVDERLGRAIVVSCIDNLIKGAAGQAVENMNLMFGWDQAAGLPVLPWQL